MQKLRDFFNQRPSSEIFHYSSAKAAIGMLETKKIWASKIRHLNDASEYTHAKNWLVDELKRRDQGTLSSALAALTSENASPVVGRIGRVAFTVATADKPVMVASFSAAENLLSQWRAYCPQGNGFSLGFDASLYAETEPLEGMRLVKCIYTDSERDDLCGALIESWSEYPDNNLSMMLKVLGDCMTVIAAVKDPSFKEEQEWRLVGMGHALQKKFRPGRHGIVPYVEVPFGGNGEIQLRKIWVGPNSDSGAAMSALEALCRDRQLNGVVFEDSLIPYRD
jgi:hypothetical protein